MTTTVFGQRFADYFVICGLDLNLGLERDRFSGLGDVYLTPLEQSYKSKVLAHYPDNVPWNPFDEEAVNMLCLPNGLNFKTQKHALQPTFHSFIITREDGSRTYGCSLTFYEKVTNKNVCAAMQTLQAMHLTDLSSGVMNASPKSPNDVDNSLGNTTRSLPRSFKLSSQDSSAAHNFYDQTKDMLYVTKSLCLIIQLPFIKGCQQFLYGLHNLITKPQPPPLSVESYIYNILYEVPVPSLGRSIAFHCFGQQIICQRPGPYELPMLDYSLREFFLTLGVDKAIQLYTCALLENQIILYSIDYHKLMLIAECIIALLFPFTWQHVYVPILPASMMQFLDAPVPFIMGLHHGNEDKSQLQLPGEANLCFVDLDSPTVELPEDLPQLPHKNEFIHELLQYLKKENILVNHVQCEKNLNHYGLRREYGRCGSIPRRRKLSWNHLEKMSHEPSPVSPRSYRHEILQQSEAVQRLAAIAKRTGVISSLHDLENPSRIDDEGNLQSDYVEHEDDTYTKELIFNNGIREIFLNRFIQLFSAYEHFVISPSKDTEQWLNSREAMQNFDKATFLSDQPDHDLPFLSRFLETQMFTTFIDNKIISHWEDHDMYIKIFDSRIKQSGRENNDPLVRTFNYEMCKTLAETEKNIRKRSVDIDITAVSPQPFDVGTVSQGYRMGFFPTLDRHILNKEPIRNRIDKKPGEQSKRKERLRQRMEQAMLFPNHQEVHKKYLAEPRSKNMKQPKLSEKTQAVIAQANWEFVEQLLRECKLKTKRMLVEKMGQEAIELGHGEISITGIEENTLIGSLCDLLERIWSHGLQSKQGKSALWSHLLSYQEIQDCHDHNKPINPNFLTPDLSMMALDPDIPSPTEKSKEKKKHNKTVESPGIRPLPVSLTLDMRNVQTMTEIKTDIGYARAWVRLSLEKKVLSKHLKILLCDEKLLKSLYKRYAFLRYDDEKEQFLYHLLTLNAVDYFCFTNTFTSALIPYRIVIFPSRKFSASSTSANAWVSLSGTLGDTGILAVPKQRLELVIQHKNLGILTTLRIGHDNTGMTPKWMVEHVLVRNEVTGHMYKFPCGRWLGKGIDDGSTERLLVGELVPASADNEELVETCRTPPRCRSPNMPRNTNENKFSVTELQQMLADAVNNIVKYYYKPEKERGSLTVLLCGEMGLVFCIEQIFLYGYKSSRLFSRHLYLWDFLVKVKIYFESILHEDDERKSGRDDFSNPHEHVIVMRLYCSLVNKVNDSSHNIGKDGKFQVFICLAAREHLLHRMMMHLATTPVTIQMYDEHSFLRDPSLVMFLVQILEALNEFPIVLESSLTKGLNS